MVTSKAKKSSDTVTIAPHAIALTIAGSDPSGGAGLQADLKTFQQLGVYGMSVVTLLTVQNTQAVRQVEVLSPQLIIAQLDAVLDDIPPRVIKTGALGAANVVQAIGERLQDVTSPIIVDPVLVSKHGDSLASDDVVAAYMEHLLPQAFLVTPNRFEAERLTGLSLDTEDSVAEAVYRLQTAGAQHVLIKLGEIDGQSHHVLSLDDENVGLITPRLPNKNTHGSGCILSAAITASMALGQTDLQSAVLFGIHRTYEAIYANTKLGKGIHPADTRGMLHDLSSID
jgi:hydroxymethylpyrimidine/phosphomethylpyrimidine kinase